MCPDTAHINQSDLNEPSGRFTFMQGRSAFHDENPLSRFRIKRVSYFSQHTVNVLLIH